MQLSYAKGGSMSHIQNQKGQSLVEYLIIVALVSVGSIAVVRTLSQSMRVRFAHVAKSLGATPSGEISEARLNSSSYESRDLRDFAQGSLSRNKKSGSSNEDD